MVLLFGISVFAGTISHTLLQTSLIDFLFLFTHLTMFISIYRFSALSILSLCEGKLNMNLSINSPSPAKLFNCLLIIF